MKISKTAKSAVIVCAAAAVLAAVLAVILLIPQPDSESESSGSEQISGIQAAITDKKADNVLRLTVKNALGEYSFERRETDSTEDSSENYSWISAQMKKAEADDSSVRLFVGNLASLNAMSTVEENAAELEKYGLDAPEAAVNISFDDGSSAEILFGIQNPANEGTVYCRLDGSNTVMLVNYYEISGVYKDIRKFARLKMTDTYTGDSSDELNYMKIDRSDLEQPIEIEFMSELSEAAEDEDYIPTTFNTHRFISPVEAEVDASAARSVIYGVYDLTMESCEYLERSEEILTECGLDIPDITVEFLIGSQKHVLTIGGKSENGYYAVFDDKKAVYSISADKYRLLNSFSVSDTISRRPLSPYIYTVDHLNIAYNSQIYRFDIDGENKKFYYQDNEIDGSDFRNLYQQLIGSVGEEFYTDQTNSEPVFSVEFCYSDDYAEKHGGKSDTLEFLPFDDRKFAVNLNGKTIFKVRRLYLSQIEEYLNKIVGGN